MTNGHEGYYELACIAMFSFYLIILTVALRDLVLIQRGRFNL